MPGPVHWHEGLFLQPHHLQSMQHHLLDRFGCTRRQMHFDCTAAHENRLGDLFQIRWLAASKNISSEPPTAGNWAITLPVSVFMTIIRPSNYQSG